MTTLTPEEMDTIWPPHPVTVGVMDPWVDRVSSLIAREVWRGEWPPYRFDYEVMEPELQADAASILRATLAIIELFFAEGEEGSS